MISSPETLSAATVHLEKQDPLLAGLISRFGPCDIVPHTNYYQELVSSIISQQLSVKAASSIQKRFVALFGGQDIPPPDLILTKTVEDFRSVGLSRGKSAYVIDLAQHVLDGRLDFDDLGPKTNQQIIEMLTAVKGVGVWTAHMFLMFSVGRLDILPVGDLGIKNAVQKLYDLDHQPTPAEIENIAEKNNWHPYETVACWYLWKSLDNKPK